MANDTTGFLTAARLSTGNTVRGNIRDDQQVLAKTSQFGSVTSGSFTVNGVDIAVDRNVDTFASLITKINNAGAGVTASYDEGADILALSSNSNSEEDIVLADDSSGFLAAANLSDASTQRGNVRDDRQVLAKTTQFSDVVSGSFSINGTSITVDRDTDSFATLLERINSAGAGVSARYDEETDKLVLTPDTPGAGLVLENDTSGFLAAAKVATGASGTRVDPNAAFNSEGGNAPYFEENAQVVAGTFVVNGTTIAVEANDTVNSVLAKITSSSAGVAATYDSVSERVTLTSTAMSDTPITLGPDTSGFLAAVKLDGTAAATTGASTLDSVLASSSVFAAVSGGTITINGQTISVNPAFDTLSRVAAAINELRGVTATLDSASGRILLQADPGGGHLEIDDTSGLMGALGIASGKIDGKAGTLKQVEVDTGRLELDDPAAVATNIAAALAKVNDALGLLNRARDVSPLFKYDTEDAVRDAMSSLSGATEKGVTLENRPDGLQLNVNVEQLASALTDDPRALDQFLAGARNLPSSLHALLATYDDVSASTPSIPESNILAPVEDARSTMFGEKTKADLFKAHGERQMLLLDAVLVRPPLHNIASRSSQSNMWMSPSEKFGQPSLIEKLKKTYGLQLERDAKPGVTRAETPWLKGLEPQNLLATSRAKESYASDNQRLRMSALGPVHGMPPSPPGLADSVGNSSSSLDLLSS